MKRSTLSIAVLACTVLGAAAGMFLRSYQLTRCMDENGLLIFGSRIAIGLAVFTAGLVLALAVICSRLPKTKGDTRYFSASLSPMLLSAAAAGALLFGCFMQFMQPGISIWLQLLFACGVVSALLLLVAALLRFNEKKVPFVLLCLPVLFLVAKLIVDFKNWSHDPAVIDFCFLLLASICAMIALFNLAGFSLNVGKRRTTVFWCMLAGVFAAITLVDHFVPSATPDWSSLLINCGLGLWCIIHGVQLLLPDLHNQPIEAEETPELPDEPTPENDAPSLAETEAESSATLDK